ncbi:hypothetical protein AMTRI_Chr08g162130 [Amborella trichopoda]
MFMLKTTVQKELLDHIQEATTPQDVWDALGTMSISQYFSKVKSLCHKISKLDLKSRITETTMRRIITRCLRPKYNGFMMAIRGWPTQPSLMELESLLAN